MKVLLLVIITAPPGCLNVHVMRWAYLAIALSQAVVFGVGVSTVVKVEASPTWQIWADETTTTTSGQEQAAVNCAPNVSSYEILMSFPGQLVIHFRSSRADADAATRCVNSRPGINGASLFYGSGVAVR